MLRCEFQESLTSAHVTKATCPQMDAIERCQSLDLHNQKISILNKEQKKTQRSSSVSETWNLILTKPFHCRVISNLISRYHKVRIPYSKEYCQFDLSSDSVSYDAWHGRSDKILSSGTIPFAGIDKKKDNN